MLVLSEEPRALKLEFRIWSLNCCGSGRGSQGGKRDALVSNGYGKMFIFGESI